jgi:hypothetical protein
MIAGGDLPASASYRAKPSAGNFGALLRNRPHPQNPTAFDGQLRRWLLVHSRHAELQPAAAYR